MTLAEQAGFALWPLFTALTGVLLAQQYAAATGLSAVALCVVALASASLASCATAAVALRKRRRCASSVLELTATGSWRLVRARAAAQAVTFGPGTRRLGPTLVIDLRRPDRRQRLWLTPWDLDPTTLRRLNLRLECERRGGER